ncbi:hypothetical protein ABPG74_022644 [Tetrahymena malaccensis]
MFCLNKISNLKKDFASFQNCRSITIKQALLLVKCILSNFIWAMINAFLIELRLTELISQFAIFSKHNICETDNQFLPTQQDQRLDKVENRKMIFNQNQQSQEIYTQSKQEKQSAISILAAKQVGNSPINRDQILLNKQKLQSINIQDLQLTDYQIELFRFSKTQSSLESILIAFKNYFQYLDLNKEFEERFLDDLNPDILFNQHLTKSLKYLNEINYFQQEIPIDFLDIKLKKSYLSEQEHIQMTIILEARPIKNGKLSLYTQNRSTYFSFLNSLKKFRYHLNILDIFIKYNFKSQNNQRSSSLRTLCHSLKNCVSLEELDFQFKQNYQKQNQKNIIFLQNSNNNLKEKDFLKTFSRGISKLFLLKSLRLEFQDCHISQQEAIPFFTGLKDFKSLNHFNLNLKNNEIDKQVFSEFQWCVAIDQNSNLQGSRFLGSFLSNQNLTTLNLNLDNIQLRSQGLLLLSQGIMQQFNLLELVLSISENKIKKEGFISLYLSLKCLKSLDKLNLNCNKEEILNIKQTERNKRLKIIRDANQLMENVSLSIIKNIEKIDNKSKQNTLNFINNYLEDSLKQNEIEQNISNKNFVKLKQSSQLFEREEANKNLSKQLKKQNSVILNNQDCLDLEKDTQQIQNSESKNFNSKQFFQKNCRSSLNFQLKNKQKFIQSQNEKSQNLDGQSQKSEFALQRLTQSRKKLSSFQTLSESLIKLTKISKISLSFESNNIISEGVVQVCYSFDYLPQLKILNLNFGKNFIQSDGFYKLAESLEFLSQLEELKMDFNCNQIDDFGLVCFSNMIKRFSRQLTTFHLNLESNKIESLLSIDYFSKKFLKHQTVSDFKLVVLDNPICLVEKDVSNNDNKNSQLDSKQTNAIGTSNNEQNKQQQFKNISRIIDLYPYSFQIEFFYLNK